MVTYLLHFLLVSLLKARNVISPLLGLLNLLPGLHLLLLEERNTISEQLGISLNAMTCQYEKIALTLFFSS